VSSCSDAEPRLPAFGLPVQLLDLAGDRSYAGQDDQDGDQGPGHLLQGADVAAGNHVEGMTQRTGNSRGITPTSIDLRRGVAEVADAGNEPLPDETGRPLEHDVDQDHFVRCLLGDPVMKGAIKRLIGDRGFGFITAESGEDYFFHHSGVVDRRFYDLAEGDQVTFDPVEPPPVEGRRARNVAPAGDRA
jgi:cold shock protein